MGAILGLSRKSGNHGNCLHRKGSIATSDSVSLEPTAAIRPGDAEEYNFRETDFRQVDEE